MSAEKRARVSLHVRVQDLDLADGLPLFMGAQLAVDTTIVSVLKRDGSARTRCANVDGASLEAARRRKGSHVPRTDWTQWEGKACPPRL